MAPTHLKDKAPGLRLILYGMTNKSVYAISKSVNGFRKKGFQ